MGQWLAENLFNVVGTLFGSGVWFAAFSIRKDAKARKEEVEARRVANLLAITANHREVWKEYMNNPKLARVCAATVNMAKQPITDTEQMFVMLVILHTNAVYYAINKKVVVEYEGLRRDIADFFSLPIPKAVWQTTKPLQNQDFAAFIDSSLK